MENQYALDKLNSVECEKYHIFIRSLNLCNSIMLNNYFLKKLKMNASLQLCTLLEKEYNSYFFERREYIDKSCYFIDYENLNNNIKEYVMNIKNAIIYYIINPTLKVSIDILDESNLVYIDSHTDKYKNSADYLLNFNLLNLVNKYRFKEVIIISNDHGFQGIVDILNNQYHQNTVLKQKKDVISTEKLSTNQIVDEVKKNLRKVNKKYLPKEKEDLKNYIKNNVYSNCLDDQQVDEVIIKIRNEGLICLYGNTIHYQGVKYYGS